MKSVSGVALGFALAIGLSTAAPQPSAAQTALTLSKQERQALRPLQQAVAAQNWSAAAAALPAAQAAARSADARYLVAALQLRAALGTQNQQAQAQAIDAIVASGGAPQTELVQIYRNQAALALNAGAREKAEAAAARWVELSPNDPEAVVTLAEVKASLVKNAEAAALFDRAIAMRRAAGQPVPESWYKRGLRLAYDTKLAPQAFKLNRDLLAAYPSAENWRDALLIYRDVGALDPVTNIDAMRLMRAAKALHGERDWYEVANTLNTAGMSGEAKAVLDEAIAAKMIDPTKATFKELVAAASRKATQDRAKLAGLDKAANAAATGTAALAAADAYFGVGDYAKAATLYRLAMQKGSVDPGLAGTRLGMALALAGQRAEAEAAFQSVTGPRAELASLWMLWLAQRA